MNLIRAFIYYSCLVERQQFEGGRAVLSDKEVLREILNANFRKNHLDFTDIESGVSFDSKYAKPPKDGMFLLKLTRRIDGLSLILFFDTRTTPNYVWLEKVTDDEKNTIYKQVTNAVVNALNKTTFMSGFTANIQEFIPGNPKDVHLFLSACKYAGKSKDSNEFIVDKETFRAIVIADVLADDVMALLLLYMKGKNTPKGIVGPLRAAKEAGTIIKITKAVFRDIFGDILGNSLSCVDKYMSDDYVWNPNDEVFKEMKKQFLFLVEKMKLNI